MGFPSPSARAVPGRLVPVRAAAARGRRRSRVGSAPRLAGAFPSPPGARGRAVARFRRCRGGLAAKPPGVDDALDAEAAGRYNYVLPAGEKCAAWKPSARPSRAAHPAAEALGLVGGRLGLVRQLDPGGVLLRRLERLGRHDGFEVLDALREALAVGG